MPEGTPRPGYVPSLHRHRPTTRVRDTDAHTMCRSPVRPREWRAHWNGNNSFSMSHFQVRTADRRRYLCSVTSRTYVSLPAPTRG